MPNTYSLIQTVTAASDTAGLTISNIPQIYADLLLKCFMRNTSGNDQAIYVYPNSSASNTKSVYLNTGPNGLQNGSLTDSGLYIGSAYNNVSTSSLAFAPCEVYIGNYSSSSYMKSCVSYNTAAQNSSTSQYANIITSTYKSTSAISSLYVTIAGGGNIVQQYSTVSLYGIRRT